MSSETFDPKWSQQFFEEINCVRNQISAALQSTSNSDDHVKILASQLENLRSQSPIIVNNDNYENVKPVAASQSFENSETYAKMKTEIRSRNLLIEKLHDKVQAYEASIEIKNRRLEEQEVLISNFSSEQQAQNSGSPNSPSLSEAREQLIANLKTLLEEKDQLISNYKINSTQLNNKITIMEKEINILERENEKFRTLKTLEYEVCDENGTVLDECSVASRTSRSRFGSYRRKKSSNRFLSQLTNVSLLSKKGSADDIYQENQVFENSSVTYAEMPKKVTSFPLVIEEQDELKSENVKLQNQIRELNSRVEELQIKKNEKKRGPKVVNKFLSHQFQRFSKYF